MKKYRSWAASVLLLMVVACGQQKEVALPEKSEPQSSATSTHATRPNSDFPTAPVAEQAAPPRQALQRVQPDAAGRETAKHAEAEAQSQAQAQRMAVKEARVRMAEAESRRLAALENAGKMAAPPLAALASRNAVSIGVGGMSAAVPDKSSEVAKPGDKHIKHSAKEKLTVDDKQVRVAAKAVANTVAENPAVVVPTVSGFEKIKAELAADPVILVPGNPGDLRVWVGDQGATANFPADMAHAAANIDTSLKPSSVKITPNAPAFKTTPQSVCALFDPTGTTVHFELVPNIERAGKFRVGAGVWLFDSSDCSGTPNPKEAPDLEVEVVVKVVPDDMWKSVRDGISKFWAGMVGLIVALLLFFARNLLKRLFGFDGK